MSNRLLFRQEALDFQTSNRQWGRVASLQPLSTKVTTWFLSLSAALIATYLSIGQYAQKETVIGYLTPTVGTSKIFVPQQGTIRAIHVREGEQVKEDQPLLTIDTSHIATNGTDVNATILETLSNQKLNLLNQIQAEQRRGDSEKDRLTALIKGLQAEIDQLQSQINVQSERVRISDQFVDVAAKLNAKGITPDIELKRRQMAVLEQKQNLESLKQQLAAKQNQLTESRYSLQQLPTVTKEKVQNLRNELSNTEQRLAEINGRRAYVLRSPTSGRVSTLQATVGQYADPKRLQLEIVPAQSTLQAEMFVPARAIGFVEPGEDVRILYDAFPYQQFGIYGGKVAQVSQTLLTGNDASGPITLKEPAYRVTATLDRPDIDAYGKKIPLQADMLLRADIVLEKRSFLSWFLDPLLRMRM